MIDKGGKGRMGLWLICGRVPSSFPGTKSINVGVMLDRQPKVMWLASFGISPGFTFGLGWVSKQRRLEDAEKAAHPMHRLVPTENGYAFEAAERDAPSF